jgi:cyclic pyranopterin monophosphate synthase
LIPAQNDEQPRLSHTNAAGEARMVDVSSKADTLRTATAGGNIRMSAAAITAIRDNAIAKGDVLGVARIAGIMAAKRTAELIPLCHQIALSHVDITLSIDETISGIHAEATAVSTGATGVEMEAIVAVSIALATIYDMAKSVDRSMVIGGVRLLRKSGGKSGEYTAGA